MVDEVGVLLGVQDFQEHRGRVAPKILADLVDFIQHEHGVLDLQALEFVDDAPGHGPHVGAAVAPELRLVPEACQGQAHELALQGLGDGLADGSLAGAGRAGEAQHGTPVHLHVALFVDDFPHRGPELIELDGLGEVVGGAFFRASTAELTVA